MLSNKTIKCSSCPRKIVVSSECDEATCYHCLQVATINTNEERTYETSDIRACSFSLPNKNCRILDSSRCIASDGKKCGYLELSVIRLDGRSCPDCGEAIGPRKQYCKKCLKEHSRIKYREKQKEKLKSENPL